MPLCCPSVASWSHTYIVLRECKWQYLESKNLGMLISRALSNKNGLARSEGSAMQSQKGNCGSYICQSKYSTISQTK